MFIQVFQGPVSDRQEARHALDEWAERLAPGAEGWLGSTSGVTDDGTFVGVARFASAGAARRNSGRTLQGEWWAAMSKLFTGEVSFHDCSEAHTGRGGGSDRAGFVQVIQGRTGDLARMRETMNVFEARFPHIRPDLVGYLVAVHDGEDGAFTQVAYFTSEEEARAAEALQPPAEAAEVLDEEMDLMRDVRYFDLREPWLYSPR
jgi:hypothetical protein